MKRVASVQVVTQPVREQVAHEVLEHVRELRARRPGGASVRAGSGETEGSSGVGDIICGFLIEVGAVNCTRGARGDSVHAGNGDTEGSSNTWRYHMRFLIRVGAVNCARGARDGSVHARNGETECNSGVGDITRAS